MQRSQPQPETPSVPENSRTPMRRAEDLGVPRPSISDASPAGARPWAGPARVALLAGSDALALFLAGVAAFLLWAHPVHGQDPALYLGVTPAIVLILLSYGQAGLYPGFGLGPVEVLRRYWLVTLGAFIILAALIFGLKVQDQYSRVTLGIAFLLSLVFIGSFRWLTMRWARRWSWWPEPVVLVGSGRRPRLMQRLLEGTPGREFKPAGTIDLEALAAAGNDAEEAIQEESRGEPASDPMEFVRAGIRVAFVDMSESPSEAALDRLRLIFPRVVVLREFEKMPVEGVQVRNLDGVLGLEYGNNLLRRRNRLAKRSLDLALAPLALLLTLPLMLAAMLAVKFLSPGPALFRQARQGRKDCPIHVPKIRTMVVDAEEQMEELFLKDPNLREEWENGFKLQDDPRIIPLVGHLLRRYSIDELPQLWSVLKGDMSLVGPRPFPSYHLEALSEQARRLRAEVRPGISGLWQVSARGLADVSAQQAYDVYYIRNWSIWLDLYILARTLSVVVSGRGAY